MKASRGVQKQFWSHNVKFQWLDCLRLVRLKEKLSHWFRKFTKWLKKSTNMLQQRKYLMRYVSWICRRGCLSWPGIIKHWKKKTKFCLSLTVETLKVMTRLIEEESPRNTISRYKIKRAIRCWKLMKKIKEHLLKEYYPLINEL
jgi:hypothetical protein